jgi:hypothetical protein
VVRLRGSCGVISTAIAVARCDIHYGGLVAVYYPLRLQLPGVISTEKKLFLRRLGTEADFLRKVPKKNTGLP